jgi:hypothetical protein
LARAHAVCCKRVYVNKGARAVARSVNVNVAARWLRARLNYAPSFDVWVEPLQLLERALCVGLCLVAVDHVAGAGVFCHAVQLVGDEEANHLRVPLFDLR